MNAGPTGDELAEFAERHLGRSLTPWQRQFWDHLMAAQPRPRRQLAEPDDWPGTPLIATWIDEEAWGRAVDPDMPPGVIVLQDADGNWWRYPLAEFTDDDG